MGTKQVCKAALNLVSLKDANEAKNRPGSTNNDKKRPRSLSEGRALCKANALYFFHDVAFGGENQEDDSGVSSESRKSLKLDKENDEEANASISSSPPLSKSAKKRKIKRIDLRNKELVKHKRRLRVRN